jgi:hypothetical protein
METFIALLWVAGIISGLLFAVKLLGFRFQSTKAKQDLECHMANSNNYNSIAAVKALLLVRGHFLPKELRVDAQNWVEEMEEKLKGE